MTNYLVSYNDHKKDRIRVTYTITAINESIIYLQLPAWRPGRYELGNFAQYLFSLELVDEKGQKVPYKKIKKDRWEINTQGIDQLEVSCTFAALIKNAGGTYKTCLLYTSPSPRDA